MEDVRIECLDTISQTATPVVLLVDDVDMNLEFLREIIVQLGYEALTAQSVREAIERMKEKCPQLILLDVMMPEIDGFQFCELLKKHPVTKDIPVVFVSAMNEMKDRERAAALGAVDYIMKPFLYEEVKMRVETHLKIYRMQKELQSQNRRLNAMISDQSMRVFEERKRMLRMVLELESLTPNLDNRGHLKRVSNNVRMLAQALNYSEAYENQISVRFIETLESAVILHDIGVLCIPLTIVNKNNRTNDEEALFQTHTTEGLKLIRDFTQSTEEKYAEVYNEIVESHHENWDGTGYPNHLKTDEIPLSARIFRVIDYYDEELFRLRMSGCDATELICERLKSGRGTLFEPTIVDTFLAIYKRLLS